MIKRVVGGCAGVVAAVGLVMACSSTTTGSSSGGTGPGAVSSVDSSKKAADLTEADAKQLCQDTNAYTKAQISESDTKKVYCGSLAAALAGFTAKTDDEAKAKCKTSLDECLAKPGDPTANPDGGAPADPCANAKKDLGSCQATVAEINQCTADQLAAYKAIVSKDFCAEAKVANPDAGTTGSSTFTEPASCKALKEKCPQLYEGQSSGGG